MKKQGISFILWMTALILTSLVFLYQLNTGPTKSVKDSEDFGLFRISYSLRRSNIAFQPLPVEITINGSIEKAVLLYRQYKAGEEWTETEMERSGDKIKSEIQGLPAAGKVEYLVKIYNKGKEYYLNKGRAVVARFRGEVPAVFIVPHIVFMFLSILFGLRTGMESLRKNGNYDWMVVATLIIVVIGGLILGPIVQKYAFGKLWTGFPLGYDLTDNKTLLAAVFWIIALVLKKRSRYWVIAAALLMIVIYLIPHSVLGSELDPKTGKIKNIF